MFKFLKEKLKSAISKISEGVEKEGKIEEKDVEVPVQDASKPEQKGFFTRIKEKFSGKEEIKVQPSVDEPEETSPKLEPISEKPAEKPHPEPPELKDAEKTTKKFEAAKPRELKEKTRKPDVKIFHKPEEIEKEKVKEELFEKIKPEIETKEIFESAEEPAKEKTEEKKTEPETLETQSVSGHQKSKGFFSEKGFFAAIKEKIITTKIDESQFEKLFWEMEMALMENNVAMEVIEKIKKDLKEQLVEKPIKRTKVEETIQEALKGSIEGLFEASSMDLLHEIKNKGEKPYVIAFFGINGSGKTTSIAKIAKLMKDRNISCVLAASDTFRAASIEQLQLHADKIGIKIIKHDYGADPAAVAFDAIKHAKAKNIDVVLIDTAGRMHSNTNLVQEMQKIVRITKPDLKIFVGESITGNDCVEQAKTFNEAVGIDGIILAKADIDEKGGAAVSVSYVTKKPILFFGTGQNYGDLQRFDPNTVIKNLGLA